MSKNKNQSYQNNYASKEYGNQVSVVINIEAKIPADDAVRLLSMLMEEVPHKIQSERCGIFLVFRQKFELPHRVFISL